MIAPDPKLLALAERVEAAEGPSEELFADVFRALFPKPPHDRVWVKPYEIWTDEYTAWQERQAFFFELIEVEAWLDAAMTLVPEGMGWVAGWGQTIPTEPMGGAMITRHAVFAGYDVANDVITEAEAATPALALTAACLKALAQGDRHD